MGYAVSMVTVLRADGLRVVIYTNDHLPAHVHVYGDGEAKIGLKALRGFTPTKPSAKPGPQTRSGSRSIRFTRA